MMNSKERPGAGALAVGKQIKEAIEKEVLQQGLNSNNMRESFASTLTPSNAGSSPLYGNQLGFFDSSCKYEENSGSRLAPHLLKDMVKKLSTF